MDDSYDDDESDDDGLHDDEDGQEDVLRGTGGRNRTVPTPYFDVLVL
jgi:hypothetical protein